MPARYTPKEMLAKLVSFDTTSRESNLALIHFVQEYLRDYGVESRLIHNDAGDKANLYATLGPEIDGGVVLSGHTDVVPVDGQDWSGDPFTMVERDGRLYGRGTCDMKGFIAIALSFAPEIMQRKLSAPIHFAFSYDEEIGCIGVDGIIQHLKSLPTRPRAVIVGEPTDMTVVNAHKGCYAIDTVVRGLEAHSSAIHIGVNSVFYAAELVHYLADMATEMKLSGNQNERFDPPYSSVHVGTIHGGTARNIIPKETKLRWEIRTVPEDDGPAMIRRVDDFAQETLLPRMREVFPEAEIRNEVVGDVHPLAPEDHADAEALVHALIGSNQTFAVSYATEAGAFQQAGVSTVICGPGSIEQAHKPDEFIDIAQVDACTDFVQRLVDHLSTN